MHYTRPQSGKRSGYYGCGGYTKWKVRQRYPDAERTVDPGAIRTSGQVICSLKDIYCPFVNQPLATEPKS